MSDLHAEYWLTILCLGDLVRVECSEDASHNNVGGMQAVERPGVFLCKKKGVLEKPMVCVNEGLSKAHRS